MLMNLRKVLTQDLRVGDCIIHPGSGQQMVLSRVTPGAWHIDFRGELTGGETHCFSIAEGHAIAVIDDE